MIPIYTSLNKRTNIAVAVHKAHNKLGHRSKEYETYYNYINAMASISCAFSLVVIIKDFLNTQNE
jgi:hypothetical protein